MSKPEFSVDNVRPLPRSVEELRTMRISKTKRNLNDLVEDCFLRLWDTNPEFVKYLDAVHKLQAITGNPDWDHYEAVQILQKFAREERISDLYGEHVKPALIGKVLNLVMKRYGIGRKQRANAFSVGVIETKRTD